MAFSAEALVLFCSIIIFAGIIIGKVGSRFGIPVLLLFLFTGMLFGVDGFGFQFSDAKMAQSIGMVALTIILFTGGMDTKIKDIRPVLGPGIVLSTVGVLLTTGFTGLFIYYISNKFDLGQEFSLPLALLLAATMSSTDSASVFGLLRSQRVQLKQNLKPALELESGSNDPMAYMLTIVLMQFIGSASVSVGQLLLQFLYQFVGGAAIGVLMGGLATLLINKLHIPNRTLYPIMLLCVLLFTFSATTLIKSNGYLAAYTAGIVVGNNRLKHRSSISNFFDGITWLVQIALFLLLGLLVNPREAMTIGLLAVPVGIFMMLLGRPLAVFISLLPFRRMTHRAKLFISWVGLRGAAPIIFATYPVVSGIEGSQHIYSIVFFITLLSLLVQGMTITPVAKRLGLATEAPPEGSFIGVEIPEETGTHMEERTVDEQMLANGAELRNVQLGENELVILIRHNDRFIVPKGRSKLHLGDSLLIVWASDESSGKENDNTLAARIRQKLMQ